MAASTISTLLLLFLALWNGCHAQNEFVCQQLKDVRGYIFKNVVTERCYQLVYEKDMFLNWGDARQYCQDNAGRMVNIDSADKQDWLNGKLNLDKNPYKPAANFDYDDPATWKTTSGADFDPVIWLGTRMETDATWRWDQYATSRTGGQVVVVWNNWHESNPSDYTLRQQREICGQMRYAPVTRNISTYTVIDTSYDWYKETDCSTSRSPTHPFMCEFEGYEFRESPTPDWMYVIIVLAVFVACGFTACAAYCLWDKIHTSYNVLQV